MIIFFGIHVVLDRVIVGHDTINAAPTFCTHSIRNILHVRRKSKKRNILIMEKTLLHMMLMISVVIHLDALPNLPGKEIYSPLPGTGEEVFVFKRLFPGQK